MGFYSIAVISLPSHYKFGSTNLCQVCFPSIHTSLIVSQYQQQYNILASHIASQGIVMVFSYTSYERHFKKCVIDPKNGNYSECTYYGY
jgi:hypothetical protein